MRRLLAYLVLAACLPAAPPSTYGEPGMARTTPCTSALRVMQVDLDYVYDANPEQQQRNANLLAERVKALRINTVFLQAFADPLGDGLARSLYFPNRWLPVRANLFGPVAQQLRTTAGVQVYAWMPVLSFDLENTLPRIVKGETNGTQATHVDRSQYRRLSPFDSQVRRQIGDMYEDLAKSAVFDGLLFHDDAVMSDFEDVGPAALQAYQEQGLPTALDALRGDPDTWHHWTRFKSETLNVFTMVLRDRAQKPSALHLKTARNLFAMPVLEPQSETWFAQNLNDFLGVYDWTVIMAMPLMEGVPAKQSHAWLETLAHRARQLDGDLSHTVFELQTRDWSAPEQPPVSARLMQAWANTLRGNGVCHFAYYPDDFHRNMPNAATIDGIMARR